MLERLPLYIQTQNYLLELFEDGTYKPGDQLPSESDLAEQLGISRPTLREALLKLEQDGAVVRRHGIGTFVTTGFKRRLKSGLERLESILQLAGQQNLQVKFDTLQVALEKADQLTADLLRISLGTQLTTVRRVIALDKTPVAFMQDCVVGSVFAPEDIDKNFKGSVLDMLVNSRHVQVSHAVADIIPVVADESLAEKLCVDPGAAILLMEEILYDDESEPIELSRNYFVPDFFRFRVVRR
jgi:GntR family transcriptional regulator